MAASLAGPQPAPISPSWPKSAAIPATNTGDYASGRADELLDAERDGLLARNLSLAPALRHQEREADEVVRE